MHPLAQANTQPLPLPEVDWRAIAPELALLVAGVVLLLVVAFWPRAGRGVAAGLTLAGLAGRRPDRLELGPGAGRLRGRGVAGRHHPLRQGHPAGRCPGHPDGGAGRHPRGRAGRQPARGLPATAVRPARDGAPGRRLRSAGGVHRPGDPVAQPVRAGWPDPPPGRPGGGHEVLPAGGVLLGVPAVRDRAATGPPADHQPAGIARPAATPPATAPCCWPGSACWRSASCSRCRRCRSTCGPPTSTRAPRPRWPRSWPPPPRWPPSRCSCGCSPGPWAAWWCRGGR